MIGWRPGRVALVAAVLYVLLTALVAVHITDPVDAAVRQWFRPDDVWGAAQLKADAVVNALSPTHMAPLLVLVGLLTAAFRRSYEPLRVVLEIAAATLVVVAVTKLLLGREDTHGQTAWLSGSYPSGHTAVVLTVLGGCVFVTTGSASWWLWSVVGLVGGVMGWCLLLEAAHWFTDVVGGFLAGIVVLATVAELRRRRSECAEVPVAAEQC